MRIFLMIDLHLSAFAPRWRFLYVVRIDAYEYSSMETLTPEVVNKIIKRIEVHNSETVNGHKRVGVDIYFTGVGLVDLATIKEMLAIAESSRP